MTPLETLAKYGLDSSIKAIKERIFKLLLLHDVDDSVVWYDVELTGIQAVEVSDLVSLLCSLAEKGERLENKYNEVRDEVLHSNETYEVNDVLEIIDSIFNEGEIK